MSMSEEGALACPIIPLKDFKNPSDDVIKSILKRAKRIAIVGLSANPKRESYRVGAYLKEKGYEIIPVNPKYNEVMGCACYPSLKDVPAGNIDIVDIFRRPEAVEAIVEDAIKVKAPVFWMQLGVVNEKAAKKAEKAGMTVIMNRCIYVEMERLFQH